MLITSSTVPRKRRFQPNWFFRRRPHSGRLFVSDFGLLAMIFRVFRGICPVAAVAPIAKIKNSVSLQLFCDYGLLSAPPGPKTAVFAAFWGCDPRFGATRQSAIAKKLQSEPIFCFWVPGEAPKQCWSVAGPIRDGGCARYGAGWTRYGVAKRGWRGVLGRLLAYRAASLLSRKISNATLLKLVFRYNGRRGFVEDQASD